MAGFTPESIFARYSDNKFVHKDELQSGVYGLSRYENGSGLALTAPVFKRRKSGK